MADEKLFSQNEVNDLIRERLNKERAKLMREAEEREAALNKREQLLNARADWSARGLPVELLESIDFSKENALESAAAVLEANIKKQSQNNNGFDSSIPPRGGFYPEGVLNYKGQGPSDEIRSRMGLK